MKFFQKVVVGLLLLCMLLSGCGKAESGLTEIEISTPLPISEEPAPVIAWQENHLALENQYESVAVTSDMIYGCLIEDEKVAVVYQNKADGKVAKQAALDNISWVQSISADEAGNVYLAGNEGEESKFWKLDSSGKVSEMGEMTLEDTDTAKHILPKEIYTDSAGNFYVWYQISIPLSEIREATEEELQLGVRAMVDRIYIKDAQMKTLFYEQFPNMGDSQLLSLKMDRSGKPSVMAKDSEGIYAQGIDVAQQQMSEAVYITDNTEFLNEAGKIFAAENGFLYCRNDNLYQCDFDTGQTESVLNLPSYGILSENILYLEKQDGRIEIIDYYGENGSAEYTILTQGTNEKELLTLGIVQPTPDLEMAVAGYNRFSPDTRVELISYYNEQDGYEAGMEKLNLDIVTGQAPDLIEVSSLDKTVFADKGILADLYEYMENDTECRQDLLMPSVLEAYNLNGRLYSIAPSFHLYSMWGNNGVINNRSGVTLAELMQLLKDNGKTLEAIFGFSADEPVLTTLCTFGMDEFVDWENAACDFTGEYFKELLTFTKEYQGGYSGSITQGIEAGEILLSVGPIFRVADYQLQSELYGGDLAFIGYPTASGSGTAISFSGSELAINAQGEHREAAWEFLKYNLLNGYNGQGFPVVKSQLEEAMKLAMETTIVSSPEGDYEAPNGTYNDGTVYIEVFEAEQAAVDAVRALIDSADNSFKYNPAILNIINEEAGSYLTGQKSIEETAEIIQNRVSLYLQEQIK